MRGCAFSIRPEVRRCSRYGVRAGHPWLVAPCEGVATLVLVWHSARRVLGARPAMIALVALGAQRRCSFSIAPRSTRTPRRCLPPRDRVRGGHGMVDLRQRTGWLVVIGFALGAAFA